MYEDKKLINVLQINDWKFRNFICIIFAIQFATFGSIGLDVIGIHIPILRQLISFIYLTFVPGILILRSLKLHKLGNAETLLYATGLSISTLMFMGFFMNSIYPLLGINKPLSTEALIITITLVILILCVISYIRDRDYSNPDFINISDILSPYFLFLCLLPFMSIFGTYMVNFYNNNVLLIILLLIISLIPLFVVHDCVPQKYFSFSIMVISISLLYHRSLISMNLWGDDIFSEYYYAQLVIFNSFWNTSIYDNLNSMLSVVLIPNFYFSISNIDLKWIIKVIIPLIYSLLPIALYKIFQKQTNIKIAFLATFLFMSFVEFYRVMPVVIRQEFGELFLVLLLLLVIDTSMNHIQKSLLTLIFSIALVSSHYAIASLYMVFFIMTMAILFINDRNLLNYLLNFNNSKTKTNIRRTFRPNFVALFLAITIVWYINFSSSSIFITLTHIGNLIATNIIENFFSPNYSESMSTALAQTTSTLYQILKYINVLFMILITIGVFIMLLKPITKDFVFMRTIFDNLHFDDEFLALSYLNFAFLLAALTFPYLSGNLGTMRIFHLTLLLLAPFGVIGYLVCTNLFNELVKIPFMKPKKILNFRVLSLFSILFLLLNSGLVHEVLRDDNPCSISLSTQKEYRELSSIFADSEVRGAEFLKYGTNDSSIYSDISGRQLLRAYVSQSRIIVFNENMNSSFNKYIYFRRLNVNGKLLIYSQQGEKTSERPYSTVTIENSILSNTISKSIKIYSSGGSEIYR